ncbi:hypothetical protein ACH40E_03170 [Streptomyces acidicola]|uniref:hypothetical protein n=1 Tax=Streptomyces acidicola TaxID=2596892 RepID=UPI0037BA7BA7
MTNEVTFRPGVEGLMAALAVAERLTADSPAAPASLDIDQHEFDYVPGTFNRPTGVRLYFHRDLASVRAFAEAFGAEMSEKSREGEWTLYTYADGALDGVPFRAWTLTNAEDAAVAA